MQLQLEINNQTDLLAEIHTRLITRFGRQGPFVKLSPVSQLVMGMIGVRTRSGTSKAAFEALTRRFADWSAVRDAPATDIQNAIRDVTYADVKAPRLKAALTAISGYNGQPTLKTIECMSVEEALSWLERLPGVGRKVATATLNFSTLRKRALVIDAHHLRALRRLKLVGERANFKQAYDRIMPLLPETWAPSDFDEHHQLMKTLGQEMCRHHIPICHRCPIKGLCPTSLKSSAARNQKTSRLP